MNRLKEKRTCMADGCGRSFIMTHGRQRFCKDPECIARREKKLAAKHMRTFRNKKTVAAANDRVLPKCNKAIFEVCGSNSFCDGCNRQTRKKDDKDLFKPVVKKKEVDPVIPACTLHKGCVYEGLCTP